MRHFVLALLALLACASCATDGSAPGAGLPQNRIAFDSGWRFFRGDAPDVAQNGTDIPTAAALLPLIGPDLVVHADPATNPGGQVSFAQTNFNDQTWRAVTLPHDWGIEGAFDQALPVGTGMLPWSGVSWYRKSFSLPAADAGKRVFLDFDGAMSYPNVWVNGRYAGGWAYGYSSFRLDVTPFLRPGGENVIAVRLNNPVRSSRWYPGGGLFRNVWLVTDDSVHFTRWGTFVTTPAITAEHATVKVDVAVDNQSDAPASATVQVQLFALNRDGQITGPVLADATSPAVNLPSGHSEKTSLTLQLAGPKRWDLASPNRYTVVTTLHRGDNVVDTAQTNFGVRTVKFDPEHGLLLNGVHVPINGVCDHADLGPLGTAINGRALERQIELLQEMGCNAIRTSHNPPAPELLDLCDRLGMLVMDEAFDTWERGKSANDYNLLFAAWHDHDLRALVRRDRNHPSVILWSVGNEIGQQGSARGNQLAAELSKIVHSEDATRPTSTANDNAGFSVPGEDYAFGFNYEFQRRLHYDAYHAANPGVPIFSSESASTLSSNGFYLYPLSNNKDVGSDTAVGQINSYDLTAPSWADAPDIEFQRQDLFPYLAGEFVWTGFDYLGEPTGGNPQRSRSSYFGIMDLMGFKKDRFFLYQARWRPDLPMAHLVPQNWNWPGFEGEITPVHVYTSGDEAELFLNGVSLGRKKKVGFKAADPIADSVYRIRFDDVKYQPGELKVVTYKDGKHWAEAVLRTTGPAAALALAPDRAALRNDGADLSYVTVSVRDSAGRYVPTASDEITFDVAGPGEIVAVGNGDATSFESFKGHQMRAFNGQCLVVMRARPGESGSIVLTAKANGLTAATTQLTAAGN